MDEQVSDSKMLKKNTQGHYIGQTRHNHVTFMIRNIKFNLYKGVSFPTDAVPLG